MAAPANEVPKSLSVRMVEKFTGKKLGDLDREIVDDVVEQIKGDVIATVATTAVKAVAGPLGLLLLLPVKAKLVYAKARKAAETKLELLHLRKGPTLLREVHDNDFVAQGDTRQRIKEFLFGAGIPSQTEAAAAPADAVDEAAKALQATIEVFADLERQADEQASELEEQRRREGDEAMGRKAEAMIADLKQQYDEVAEVVATAAHTGAEATPALSAPRGEAAGLPPVATVQAAARDVIEAKDPKRAAASPPRGGALPASREGVAPAQQVPVSGAGELGPTKDARAVAPEGASDDWGALSWEQLHELEQAVAVVEYGFQKSDATSKEGRFTNAIRGNVTLPLRTALTRAFEARQIPGSAYTPEKMRSDCRALDGMLERELPALIRSAFDCTAPQLKENVLEKVSPDLLLAVWNRHAREDSVVGTWFDLEKDTTAKFDLGEGLQFQSDADYQQFMQQKITVVSRQAGFRVLVHLRDRLKGMKENLFALQERKRLA